MKRKLLPKSLFLSVAVFSLSAFIFVNLHANLTGSAQVCPKAVSEQAELKECTENQDVAVPDVTVLSRLFELAQRFLPVAN